MSFWNRFAEGDLRLGRIEAFSDGVFAIVVTLLVLELKVPDLSHPSVPVLGRELVALLPKLLSWLISFVIVCKFWLNHHHILGLARSADYGMVWVNSIFLMFQSFVPFPTALMGDHPENPLAVSLFGVVMAFNTVLFLLLHRYIVRRRLKPELAGARLPDPFRQGLVGPLGYLAGAAVAWIAPHAAFACYLVTPLFFITPARDRPAAL